MFSWHILSKIVWFTWKTLKRHDILTENRGAKYLETYYRKKLDKEYASMVEPHLVDGTNP